MPPSSRIGALFSNDPNAQQGARANDPTCHASCRARSHAKQGRGSSLTLAKIMPLQDFTLQCERCNESHTVQLDPSTFTHEQRNRKAPVLTFECPNVAFMYRVLGFALDTRVHFVRSPEASESKNQIIDSLKREWGEQDFESKLTRYTDLGFSLMGIPEEYYELLWQVISTYCCGRFYPTMTSAGALGERIINRLILKTRDYHKASKHYKKLYAKNSVLDWDFAADVLLEWKVISPEVRDALFRLKKFRNDSIHYNSPYDFSANAKLAIGELAFVIEKQFSYFERKDILWVFDIPGEIWIKSASEQDPFVREFILPHCLRLTPY
jgi:hypothetical protein